MDATVDPASFRDPSGFIFRGTDGSLYRQVNRVYESHFRKFMECGLYEKLVSDRLLVSHCDVDIEKAATPDASSVFQPQELPFMSYPYEWSFSALKDAALLTLQIQQTAMEHGMSLKDASAYNVQFQGTRPIFIDTLSFEPYEATQPWVAYGQFCRHFLAPLALMSQTDIRLQQMLRTSIDGIPLDLAAKLLPFSSRMKPGLLVHIHLLAKMVTSYSSTDSNSSSQKKKAQRSVSSGGLVAIIEHLRKIIKKLKWRPRGTEWSDYYEDNSYSSSALTAKEQVVADYLTRLKPKCVWDLGANTGKFSRLATALDSQTYSFDIDPACVEQNYLRGRSEDDGLILPLLMDLTNPSPSIGWAHSERQSLMKRGSADVVMALALIHHLAISNNVPFSKIAKFLSALGKNLIIEFVPKQDPQVQRLLQSREDVFDTYTRSHFEAEFNEQFSITEQKEIGEDGRVLYLAKRRIEP